MDVRGNASGLKGIYKVRPATAGAGGRKGAAAGGRSGDPQLRPVTPALTHAASLDVPEIERREAARGSFSAAFAALPIGPKEEFVVGGPAAALKPQVEKNTI